MTLGQGLTTFKISGQVLNESDNTPVPYAHIRVKGKPIGISANSEGKFVLDLDKIMENESLVFSSIGYKSKIVNIQDFIKDPIVLLQESVTVLAEVVVTTGSDAQEIVLAAIKNFTRNYSKDPFQLSGFYRTSYRENDRYVRLLEASITVADKGFGTPNGYQVKVEQNRQSNDYRNFKWQQGGNYLSSYLRKDNIRNQRFFLNKKSMKEYNYYLEDLTELDGDEIYHIKIDLKDTMSVTYFADVYVRSKDYAIVQINDSTVIKNSSRYKVADTLQIEFTGGATQAKYVDVGGTLYLSYSSALSMHNVFDEKGDLMGTLDLEEELLVLDVIQVNPRTSGNVKRQGDIYKAKYPYDPKFWENFNLPVETELYKKIKKDLNSKEDLNEQFQKNGLSK